MVKHIVIFASGGGSNAEVIMKHFHASEQAKVVALVCNKPSAGVVNKAARNGVPVIYIDKDTLNGPGLPLKLKSLRTDLIVLAGFLWLIPKRLIQSFHIINIHPSLLPKYGGNGMYGMNVHRAVIENKEAQSGMTVHEVTEEYDKGKIIWQDHCNVSSEDTPDTLAAKVLQLEHKNYVRAIEKVLF